MKTRLCLLGLLWMTTVSPAAESTPDVQPLVRTLMSDEQQLRGVPFGDVVRATTGKKILPLDTNAASDRELLAKIGRALDKVLERMNAPDNAAHKEKRINEVSAHFEAALLKALNEIEGFRCDYPKTAGGKTQRSGYPDLRLEDKTTGRVLYLDPKLFEQNSRNSTLRTFYYEPKTDTNKILDNAHHLLVGFAHGGKAGEQWKFLRWELVDLSKFRVKLKAEFQGSNRDLYRDEAIVGRSGK